LIPEHDPFPSPVEQAMVLIEINLDRREHHLPTGLEATPDTSLRLPNREHSHVLSASDVVNVVPTALQQNATRAASSRGPGVFDCRYNQGFSVSLSAWRSHD
jgi:hypothetical protein